MTDDSKITERLVRTMPRARLEAEPIAEFPIENRPPSKHENAVVAVKDKPSRKRKVTDLTQAKVESLSQPTALNYAERKRALVPLALVAKPRKAFDLERDKRWAERRGHGTEQAKADADRVREELKHSVSQMPMRWDRQKPKA